MPWRLIHRVNVTGGGGAGRGVPQGSVLTPALFTRSPLQPARGGSTARAQAAPHYPSIIDRRVIRAATWRGPSLGRATANDRMGPARRPPGRTEPG